MNSGVILLSAVDLFLKCTLVVGFALLFLRFWKRASAAQRGCVWSVVFALLIALPATRWVAPHWALSLPESARMENLNDNSAHPEAPSNLPENAPHALPVASFRPTLDEATIVACVWLAGAILLFGYRLIGVVLLRRCHRASSSLQGTDEQALADSIAAAYGIARPVDIRWSKHCHVPVTWGTWRPVVMLPGAALDWPRNWLESALRHEMAHVKKLDHLKCWVASLACAFYWPNPLVWVAAKRLRVAQEEMSDNLVLEAGIAPQTYAAQLVEVIRATPDRRVFSFPVMAMARHSSLEGRISAILDEKRNRQTVGWRLVMAGLGVVVILGIALGAAQLRADDAFSPSDFRPHTTDADQALYDQSLNKLMLPNIDLRQATLSEALSAIRKATLSTNPRGLELRWLGPMSDEAYLLKFDFKLENGSVRDAIAQLAREAHLQYRITPLYSYYIEDGVSVPVLTPHITRVLCTLWPASSPETMWSRDLLLTDGGMRLLDLQPGASGDVRKGLEKWGIQFPPGTFARCKPLKGKPGQNELEISNTGDEVAQIISLNMAVSPEEWSAAPVSKK